MAQGFTLNDIAGASSSRLLNSTINDGTEYVTCPIERVHTIRWESLQFHLKKCIANYKGKDEKKPCPFDATHRISVSDMMDHVNNCPKRAIFDTFKYNVGVQEVSADIPPPPVIPNIEEEWDDCNHPTYDKEKQLEDRLIFRKKIGAQPAERKRFRNEQRHKFSQ